MNNSQTISLQDLTGRHILTGWGREMGSISYRRITSARPEYTPEKFYFTLDGITFVAEEDPDDGYRSLLGSIHNLDVVPELLPQSYTQIPYVEVVCDFGILPQHEEILYMDDAVTGKTIVELGTDYTDNYYPCFIANIYPENIHYNQQEDV